MSFYVHLKSEDDFYVEVNTLSPFLLLKNASSPVEIENTEDAPLIFKITPIRTYCEHKKLLPYAAVFYVQNNVAESTSSLLDIVEHPNSHYDITFLQNTTSEHTLPKILEQQTFYIKNREHIFSVFYDGIYELSIQEKELLLNKEIPYSIKNVSLEKIKNKDIVVIQTTTNNLENYALILQYKNNNYEVVKEGIIDKIEYNQELITTLEKQNDMAGHGMVEEYEIKDTGVIKKDSYFVYMNEKPKTTQIRELVPYAFLEAIKIKNFSLARTYLTEELNENLLDEHLEAYFGNILDIVPNVYNKNDENTVCVIQDGIIKKAKYFTVLLEKNKISNITEA